MPEQLDYAGTTMPEAEVATRKRAATLARIAGIAALAFAALLLVDIVWAFSSGSLRFISSQLVLLGKTAILLAFGIVTIVGAKHLRQRSKGWTYAVRSLALGSFLLCGWGLVRDVMALMQDGWGVLLTHPQLIPIELLILAVTVLAAATYVAMFRLTRIK